MNTTGILGAGLLALTATATAAATTATTAGAQLLPGVPNVGGALPRVGDVLDRTTDVAGRTTRELADLRLDRIAALVRANPGRVALDPQGFPARAGEMVLTDPDAATVVAATARGFALIEREDALGIQYVRLPAPIGGNVRR